MFKRSLKISPPKLRHFSVHSEMTKNNMLVSDKLLLPIKEGLPAIGAPGQIVFNSIDNAFYGWNGSEWVSFAGGGNGGYERITLANETSINPNVKNTLVQGVSAVASWATKVAGTGEESYDYYQELIAINNLDQVVTSVIYDSNPLNIYNTNGSFAFSLPFSGASYNTALVRWSPNGSAHCIGRLSTENDARGTAIDINDRNEIIVSGFYNNTLLVYNGDQSVSFEMSREGNADTFLIKYNINGTAEWGAKIAGVNREESQGNAINNNGDIAVVSMFQSPQVDVYNSNGAITFTLMKEGNRGSLVVKYNSDGFADWAAKSGSDGYIYYQSLDISNSGEPIIGGSVDSSYLNIYNKSDTLALTFASNGVSNSLLIKYTSIGDVDWAVLLQSTSNNEIWGVSTNTFGNIYVSGYFIEDLSIYNGDGTFATTLIPIYNMAYNDYIIKYSSSGEYIWSAIIASQGDNLYWQDICATDDSDNVYFIDSNSYNNIEFYNQDRSLAFTLPSNNLTAFLVKYDSNGNAYWRTKIDNINVSGQDYGWSVACNNSGHVVITGSYNSSPVNVYNSNDSVAATLDNEGNYDAFIVKYNSVDGDVILGNPIGDGQHKVITTNGPTVKITTTSPIEEVNNSILLRQYQSVEMLWDALENEWIVINTDGTLF